MSNLKIAKSQKTNHIPPGDPALKKFFPLAEDKTHRARELATMVDGFGSDAEVNLQLSAEDHEALQNAVDALYRINRQGIYTFQPKEV
jgi:hypothetical protein